jgi:O-succinylbenzoic acid--CoA ligase
MAMSTVMDCFNQRLTQNWLIGYPQETLNELIEQRLRQVSNWDSPVRVLLAERNPVRFLAGFIAACARNAHLFLGNPDWSLGEWQSVVDMVQPDLVWKGEEGGEGEVHKVSEPNTRYRLPAIYPLIMIPTGGSCGQLRFAVHTWETLMAAIAGFQQYFDVKQVNSFCVLPLYHVSGLMQFLRSLMSGGRLVLLPFKELETGRTVDIQPETFFLSLVPTQLQRLLNQPALIPWLSRFQTVLLGGAPPWSELLETARTHQIRLAPTYGMTETAAQVATLKPEAFLQGYSGCGQVLPHAHIQICTPTGQPVDAAQTGIITIHASSLAIGYYPFPHSSSPFSPLPALFSDPPALPTDDLGFLDQQGYLHIVGRSSDKIITGGENVFPAEVEAVIRATGFVQDVCVIGVSDRHWGQTVTALYVPSSPEVSPEKLQTAVKTRLSKFKQPKQWIAVDQLPRNAQGKLSRPQIEQMVGGLQINTSKE